MSLVTTPRIGWLGKFVLAGLLSSVGGIASAAGYERLELPASNGEPAIQADAGFVVVTFNHPGDTFGDDSLGRLSMFESRPRDVRRVISFMLENWSSRQHLDSQSIGIFGFSRGGYTALALVGAIPSINASAERLCGDWWSFTVPLCRQLQSGGARVTPQADPRIGAAVTMFFRRHLQSGAHP